MCYLFSFWTWSSSSLCYFPFAWLADTACWFWLPHSLYPVGSLTPFQTHSLLSASTRSTTPHTGPIRSNLQVRASMKLECKMNFQFFYANSGCFFFNGTEKDLMVLKKEVCCNYSCSKSKQIKHFRYSFNNCSTGNALLEHLSVQTINQPS